MVEVVILVDYENVQPIAEDLQQVDAARHLLKIFHGPGQNSMPIKLAAALLPIGLAVEFIQCEKAGKDALDFHLAFHLGRLTMQHPEADFVIVSRDRKGFAQLVEHGIKLGCRVSLVPSMHGEEPGSGSGPAVAVASPTKPDSPTGTAPAAPTPAKASSTKATAQPAAAKKSPARKAATKKVAAKAVPAKKIASKTTARKTAAAKKVPAKKTVGATVAAAPIVPPPAVESVPATAEPPAPLTPTSKPLRQAHTPSDVTKALASLGKVTRDKRPAKSTTLHHHLQSHLRADLTEAAIEELLRTLFSQGWVSEGLSGKIEYHLPPT